MARKVRERPAATPWLRAFLRAPIGLYRAGLGWLLGERFLLLQHTGRKSGKLRRTVLQVFSVDRETNTYYVTVGFGPRSDWFKNLQHTPQAQIEVGRRKLAVTARALDHEAGAALMATYAQANPKAAAMLAKVNGFEVDGSTADYAELPRLGLQLVALRAA